jgi:hypothetical protein
MHVYIVILAKITVYAPCIYTYGSGQPLESHIQTSSTAVTFLQVGAHVAAVAAASAPGTVLDNCYKKHIFIYIFM